MLYQTHGLQKAYNFPIKINFILSFGKPLIYIIYLLSVLLLHHIHILYTMYIIYYTYNYITYSLRPTMP